MRFLGTCITLLSTLFFPWPLTAFLALGVAFFEPLVPLVTGLLIDTLYFVPHGASVPLFALSGALVTTMIFLVRSRLMTSSIER